MPDPKAAHGEADRSERRIEGRPLSWQLQQPLNASGETIFDCGVMFTTETVVRIDLQHREKGIGSYQVLERLYRREVYSLTCY